MVKYTYHPEKGFWYGLPARDLDDSELQEYQLPLLRLAVAQGVFTANRETPKKVEDQPNNESGRS